MANKDTFIEMGAGGAQPNISREKIVRFLFALPPENEQHKIVSKIDLLLQSLKWSSFSILATILDCSSMGGKGTKVLCKALDENPLIPIPLPPIIPDRL